MRKVAYLFSVAALLVAALPFTQAHAAQVTSRKVTLSNSAASAASTTYTFSFIPAAATNIKSVNIDICDSASGSCSPAGVGVPVGFTGTGAAVGTISGIGAGGSWTGTFTTNGRLRIANNSNAGAPGTVSLQFTNLTNPSTANSTFFARITTYSDATWTTPIDSGVVAASTSNAITVTGTVDETLTFCTGTSGITSSSCAGATGTSVNLGALTPSSTGSGTSQIGISTNASTGYAVTVAGNTLTSGSHTISALAAQTASSQNSSQFGINLKANTVPAVGSDVAGTGSATPTANYNTANQFRFVSGDTIASNAGADNFRLFTVSYIANITGSTPAGSYTTAINYVGTATY